MSRVFGIRHPRLPALGTLGQRASLPLIRAASRRWHLHAPDGDFARERGAAPQDKLRRGEPVYLHGMDGVLFLAKEGTALLAWHAVEREQKDGGRRLRSLLEEWRSSTAERAIAPGRALRLRASPPGSNTC
jgi:hypothetical protein